MDITTENILDLLTMPEVANINFDVPQLNQTIFHSVELLNPLD